LRIADNCNYICWALIAAALHADRCERRDSGGILRRHVPFRFASSSHVGLSLHFGIRLDRFTQRPATS